jgi:hypothetical protein
MTIFKWILEINSTDNEFVVFRMLVNLVDNGDGFLVTVDAVAVVDLTITCLWLYICQVRDF